MVLNIILLASASGMCFTIAWLPLAAFTEEIEGFASLRIYAICGMNRFVFLLVLALAMINPAISIVSGSMMFFRRWKRYMFCFTVLLHVDHAPTIAFRQYEWLCRGYFQ